MRILFIEPYMGASHAAFAEALMCHVPAQWKLVGLAGRHFRWRMRGAGLWLARARKGLLAQPWDGLICSEMLNLAELKGLVPGLSRLKSIVIFHENQLTYPPTGSASSLQRERDLFLGLSNITTALAATRVVFNSRWHMREFLAAARELLARLPDMHPPGVVEEIAAKSLALPIPVELPDPLPPRPPRKGPLRLVWPHRWEHDKAPEEFFTAVEQVLARGGELRVCVLGPSSPPSLPEPFRRARDVLGKALVHMGRVGREEYWKWLGWADVVVSTARQEFFGLAVAEAVAAGCMPLVPDELVYPELYPPECRYGRADLADVLAELAADPERIRARDWSGLARDLLWAKQGPRWRQLIEELFG